jgi:hypothetical protein
VTKHNTNFPYDNLSLINLPKERWKAIPGFEDYYEISNYGRIKSPARKVLTKGGSLRWTEERILKAHVVKGYNKTLKTPIYNLNITLFVDNVRSYIPIARYVYFLFKEKFELKNKRIFVSLKDHDGRNVHVSNLVKSGMQALKLASYKEGRSRSHLRKLSRPVTQFDQRGKPIRTFPSMYEAGKTLQINERNIIEVVNGPGNMYKGYFWKTGVHTRNLNLKKLLLSGKELPVINTSLQKRLGIKKIDKKNLPAFLNLSLTSMKREVWKDFPGYKGLYRISNYGRVKALQKITEGAKRMWMPERMKMLTVDFRKRSKNAKEVAGSMLVTLAKAGNKKTHSVSRIVYYLFVKKFNLSDVSMRVYYKDGNSLNAYYKNLLLKRGVWSFTNIKSFDAKT